MATETLNLKVEGMAFQHCEASVKKVVGALDGVESVQVDFRGKKVTVSLDSDKVSVQTIKDVIEDQGYTVKQAIY